MIIAFIVNYGLKHSWFYLDCAAEIHICYNKSLFSIYKEENSLFIHIPDHTKLNIDVHVDGKLKVVNLYNIFYASELKYNFLLIGTIERAGHSILAKKGKMSIFDNKENVTLKATKIGTSYLVNILASKKTLALASLRLVLHNYAL